MRRGQNRQSGCHYQNERRQDSFHRNLLETARQTADLFYNNAVGLFGGFVGGARLYTQIMRIPVLAHLCALAVWAAGFQSSDGLKLRSAGTARLSPDGSRIAY